jgi:hypothetical protein
MFESCIHSNQISFPLIRLHFLQTLTIFTYKLNVGQP